MILRCRDNSYYTGVTNNIGKRLLEHQEALDPASYTASRRPVELVYYEIFSLIRDAIAFEKQVKGWSRKKKEALISHNWDRLRELAACRNVTSHLNNKS